MTSGNRLAGDLRSIRRKKGVDRKEVLDATRLADDVIEALEENGLVDHPAFNKVYLRSLYGAYGDAISIRKDDMLKALEEVFAGNYVGSLARKYLGVAPEESPANEIATDEPAESDTIALPEDAEEVDNAGADGAEEEEESAESVPQLTPVNPEEKVDPEEPRKVRALEQEARMDDWVWKGIPAKGRVLLPNMSGTALVVIAALAFLALIWYAVSSLLDMRDVDGNDVIAQDTTLALEVVRPEPVVLPDSFRVDIIALTEVLDPIRVTVDRDLRRPFWVEHLDTIPFIVVDRIQLEREVDHARVIVDGFRVPQAWLAPEGLVELSRDRIQSWLDSLTTAGVVPQRDGSYR